MKNYITDFIVRALMCLGIVSMGFAMLLFFCWGIVELTIYEHIHSPKKQAEIALLYAQAKYYEEQNHCEQDTTFLMDEK
jgi:hypothetical protein